MKVQVDELSPVERKLSIEVEPAQVAQELDLAYSKLGKQVKVPGFRPGKVPRRILEQRFRSEVEGDVLQRVVSRACFEAIQSEKVDAVSYPELVRADTLKRDAPFSFEAKVEIRPTVKLESYKGLELTKREVKVEEAQVDERIEQLRERLSRLEPVEGREVAEKGDFAVVDYVGSIDGQPFPGGTAENVTVEVVPGSIEEANVEEMAGAKIGETRELDHAFPGDYRIAEVKGKTAHFELTLKGIKQRIVPALDDELARESQMGESLDEMRKKIREELEQGEIRKLETESRDEVIEKVIAANPLLVPKAMVDRAIDSMMEAGLRNLMGSGLDPRSLQLDFGKLREEMRERAEREVKGTLLFEAIADAEKLEVTDEDIEKRMERVASESGQPLSTVRKHYKKPETREGLRLKLREEKTIEFLQAQAKDAA